MLKICVLLFFFSLLFAQEKLTFTSYKSSDGLPHNSIVSITEDEHGFIWFGTLNGFSRFDGHSFLNFLPSDSAFAFLNSQLTLLHFVDSDHRLWLNGGGKGNISIFNTKTLTLDTIPNLQHDSKPVRLSPSGFALVNNEQIWMLNNSLQVESKKPLRALTAPHTGNAKHRVFHVDESRLIYTLFNDTLYAFGNFETLKFKVPLRNFAAKNAEVNLLEVFIDSKKQTWVGSYELGTLVFNERGKLLNRFTRRELGSNSVYTFGERDGIIYIGTRGGLSLIKNGKFIQRYAHKANTIGTLSSDAISRIYFSASDKMWVTTYGGGFNVAELRKPLFDVIRDGENASLTSNFTSGILKTKTHLWTSTIDGLNRKDLASGEWTQFYHNPKKPAGLAHNVLFNITEGADGSVWIATDGGGLNRYVGGKFQRFALPEGLNSLHPMRVHMVKNTLWIGHKTEGLNIYENGRFAKLMHNPSDTASISGNNIRDIFEDRRGNIWVSTVHSGVNKIDPKTRAAKRIIAPFLLGNEPYKAIWVIVDDANGRIWFGSSKNGLFSLDEKTGDVKHYTTANGLANNTIYAIENDRDKFLWISTNNGLSQLNLETLRFRNFYEKDNLQNNEFNQFSSFKDENGILYFGGISGVNYFDPKAVNEAKTDVQLTLTGFKLLNTDVFHPAQLPHVSGHTISYDQKFLSFDFTAIGMANLTYKFRLLGQSNDWIYAGKHTSASFTNLREGNYTFEVTIHEENTAFRATPAQFKLTVLPPWFRTPWAYALFALLAIALFYFGRWLAKNWRFLISPRTKFIGKFKIIGTLGVGSMAKVYEAYDPDRKHAVAIKVIEAEENTSDDIFRMFIKEAEIGKLFSHENVLRIFDAGTANSLRYLTMEKVDGITLKTAITDGLIQNDRQRFALAAKLLNALEHLHANDVIHRDLKSTNVMVNLEADTLKLMDFGLSSSRQLVSLADRSAIVGTLAYMSPEQTIGKGVDQRSDIYAFGVVLYELFFADLPFKAGNEMELIFAIHNETPEQFIVSTHPVLELIKRCMERDVDKRFAAVKDVRSSLAQFLEESHLEEL